MTFDQIFRDNDFVLSYELFPPKTDEGMAALEENLRALFKFKPDFVTCTYGAGGSTRDKTLETLARVQKIGKGPVASHLTCVNATADELRAYLRRASAQGIQNIVAIRGDAPKGHTTFQATEGGLRYGSDLVKLIRSEFPKFGIAVGGYPETHPEALSAEADLDNLKRKVDCGADVVITQLYFNNADFYRFRDRCAVAGIRVPIVPGIIPATSFEQINRMTSLCGAKLPPKFRADLERAAPDPEAQYEVGVAHAIAQCEDLKEQGVPGIHFYVLNKSRATTEVLHALHVPED
jgi:methylenetetrahydrofolate reductase (NADPH)